MECLLPMAPPLLALSSGEVVYEGLQMKPLQSLRPSASIKHLDLISAKMSSTIGTMMIEDTAGRQMENICLTNEVFWLLCSKIQTLQMWTKMGPFISTMSKFGIFFTDATNSAKNSPSFHFSLQERCHELWSLSNSNMPTRQDHVTCLVTKSLFGLLHVVSRWRTSCERRLSFPRSVVQSSRNFCSTISW